jgi:mRNA interferase RelE/StbE
MNYAVELSPAAARQLERLPSAAQRRIVAALFDLETNPRPPGVVKLAGDANLWRIRVGDYRVVYEIHDGRLLVLVVRIGHRKDVYRDR